MDETTSKKAASDEESRGSQNAGIADGSGGGVADGSGGGVADGSGGAAAAGTAAAAASGSVSASKEDDDATIAQALHVMEQLTVLFGFSQSAAAEAVEAVGCRDVSLACQYILDNGLGNDQGGPIVPIDSCPHVEDHVKVLPWDLPNQPHMVPCSHYKDQAAEQQQQQQLTNNNNNENNTKGKGQPKSDILYNDNNDDDGNDMNNDQNQTQSCPPGENWLCLECGAIRCSRYVNGHGLAHWQSTIQQQGDNGNNNYPGHCVAASLADLSVWCHVCQAYIRHEALLNPLIRKLEHLKFNDKEEEPERKKHRSEESLAEAAARGIPISLSDDDDDLLGGDNLVDYQGILDDSDDDIRLHDDDDEDEDDDEDGERLEYPFGDLPTSLQQVADFIKSDKCRSILILAGAGMSVASGIPDFRSPQTGLYATMDPGQLTATEVERQAIRIDPSVALEYGMFMQNPLPCLEVNRAFVLGTRDRQWKATLAHRFVELLQMKYPHKFKRLYTQNIDGLEDQCSNLPRDKVVTVHGSMDQAECAHCHYEMDFQTFANWMQTNIKDITGQDQSAPAESTPMPCPRCGQGTMKPAIVLFRSNLPRRFFELVPHDVKNVDLLLIMGTSLRVSPANSLVWRIPKTALRVLMNRDPVGQHLGMEYHHGRRDFFSQGDCDQVVLDLLIRLGWLSDLESLLNHEEDKLLPADSARLLRERLAQQANQS